MRGKLPAGAGPSPARPDRYKKGSFVRLHPEKWAELAPRLDPELRATYWSLLGLAPAGEFNERSLGKLANLLGVKPTQARELVDRLSSTQFAGGPLCFVEQRTDRIIVRLAINNGLLVLHGAPAPEAAAPAAAPRRLAPSADFRALIPAARRTLAAAAGDGVLELADSLVAALAEQEPDGQLPGGRQMAIFSFLTTKHSAGNGHVGDALRDVLNRPELPTDVLSYLEASIQSRVERGGHRRQSEPLPAPHVDQPGADLDDEPSDEPQVRRTADGRRIADDFNPDDMF